MTRLQDCPYGTGLMSDTQNAGKRKRAPLVPGLNPDAPEGTPEPAAKTATVEKPVAPEPKSADDEVGGRGCFDQNRYGDERHLESECVCIPRETARRYFDQTGRELQPHRD